MKKSLITATAVIIPFFLIVFQQKYLVMKISAALVGDINQDGIVNILDYTLFSTSFGTSAGSSGFNPQADLNSDGTINILDYTILSANFGKSEPVVSPTNPPVNNSFQPSAPYYATFFYLWSENPNTDGRWSYWSDYSNNPPNTWFSHYLPDPDPAKFDPANELYSSHNEAILNWQFSKLKEARIEVAIGSWWGPNHKSDTAFRKIITDMMNRSANPYPNLRWALYYEKEGFGDPAVDSELVPDLTYIVNNYTSQKGFLKINGRPVIFVYNAAHSGFNALNDLSRWQSAKSKVKNATGVDLYVVLKRDPLSAGAAENAIDDWHEYAPAVRTNSKSPFWYMVSPGFWLDNGSAVRLGRDLTAFTSAVQSMVGSSARWKLIETWNEWGEGSSVEPADPVRFNSSNGKEEIDPGAVPFKNQYINILNQHLPPLE